MVRGIGESRANGIASPSCSPIPSRNTVATVATNRSLSEHSSPGVWLPLYHLRFRVGFSLALDLSNFNEQHIFIKVAIVALMFRHGLSQVVLNAINQCTAGMTSWRVQAVIGFVMTLVILTIGASNYIV